MKKMYFLLFCLAFFLALGKGAEARIYILIDQPSEKKLPLAISHFAVDGKTAEVAAEMEALLTKDMQIAGYFDLLAPSQFLSDPTPRTFVDSEVDFSVWQAVGTDALVKGQLTAKGNTITADWYLYDVEMKKQLVGKQYTFAKEDAYKAVHRFANEIISALTGSRGIFETQIAAACGPSDKRQIVTFYPDGTGRSQLTSTKTNNFSPDWSAATGQIVYTGTTTVKKAFKRPDLYLIGGKKPLYSRGTLSLTPAFSPSGNEVALMNTVSEDPELYIIDLNGNLISRLTNSWRIDISPTWSPDGSQLIFASERAGGLHLFKTSRGGDGAQRLTFVGYQNDQPDWAPTGDKVAFTSRDRGHFDIFIMNPDGSKIERLTNQEGDNENPSWSPDGRYLTFSSTRGGKSQLYVMGWDGANPTKLSEDTCVNPDWSGWGKE